MLILNHITSTSGQEERCIKITICQKHGLSSSKDRKTSNQLNANKTNRPYKQRQTIKSHSLCTHICYSHKKVNTSLNTSNTRNVQTENCLINRCTGVTQRTAQRRISFLLNEQKSTDFFFVLFFQKKEDKGSLPSLSPKRSDYTIIQKDFFFSLKTFSFFL
jgi:hypothetical protein